jgi:cyclophilin family peptidyl-prolyl cis-trans isomerase
MKRKLAVLSLLLFTTVFTSGCSGVSDLFNKNGSTEQAENDSKASDEKSNTSTKSNKKDDSKDKDSDTSNSSAESSSEKNPFDTAIHKVTELPQLAGVQKGDTIATIHTNMGDIKVWFFPKYAPKAVENFTTHAKEGYYDNVIFHRVINQFMIQGGDPQGTGTGGESIWGKEFENEVDSNLRSFRGALCMANAGADTNGSQFYIVQNNDIGDSLKEGLINIASQKDEEYYTTTDGKKITIGDVFPQEVIDEYVDNGGYPSLDFQYTIFGQVYEGMDVVDKIAAVETDENDKPVKDVVIESIDVDVYKK